MAFGNELKDFVSGFSAGWKLVDNSRSSKAYAEDIELRKQGRDKGKPPKDWLNEEVEKGMSQPLPVLGDTTDMPKPKVAPSYARGGKVIPDESRTSRRSRYRDRKTGALLIGEDDQPYEGGEDETFTPIGDRPSATEQVAAPQPTRRMGQRDTLPPPEDVQRPGAREIVGDMPGRSRGVGGETSARDPGAHLPPGYRPLPEPAPVVGAREIVGDMPGRGRAPYPAESYRAGTEVGAYDDPGYVPQPAGGSEQPPLARREPTPAIPVEGGPASGGASPAKVAGAVVGARSAARSSGAGREGAVRPAAPGSTGKVGAVDTGSLVSAQEIKANNMTPDQVNELNEARKASQRMSTSRGEDPNAHIQRRPLVATVDEGGDAVDAGISFLSKVFGFNGNGAVPSPDSQSAGANGVRRFLAGELSAKPQDVKAAEAAVDPTGEMSQARRAMLTLAATHKWYLMEGRPKEAQAAAASLLQYYQLTAGRLGAIAKVAMQNGDIPGAVKAATHAYNITPDGSELETKLQPNGKVAYRVTDLSSGKVTAQGAGPAQQLLSQALQNANPVSYLTQAAGVRAARRAGGGGGGGRAAAAAAPVGGGDPAAEEAYFAAKKALATAEPGSPEADKAETDMRAAYNAMLKSVPVGRGKGQSSATYALNQRGITAPGVGGAATGAVKASGGGGTAEERENARYDAELAGMSKLEGRIGVNEEAGISSEGGRLKPSMDPTSTGMRSESASIEQAKRDFQPVRGAIDAKRADIGYAREKGRKEYDKPFADRIEPYAAAYDALLKEGKTDANGQVDPRSVRAVDPQQRRQFLDLADKVAAKNDVNPDTLVRALDGMANNIAGPAPQVTADGIVRYNGQNLRVDSSVLAQLAAMRGANVRKFREELAAREKSDMAETERRTVERIDRSAASSRDRYTGSPAMPPELMERRSQSRGALPLPADLMTTGDKARRVDRQETERMRNSRMPSGTRSREDEARRRADALEDQRR